LLFAGYDPLKKKRGIGSPACRVWAMGRTPFFGLRNVQKLAEEFGAEESNQEPVIARSVFCDEAIPNGFEILLCNGID
jgi:hypothetical protein